MNFCVFKGILTLAFGNVLVVSAFASASNINDFSEKNDTVKVNLAEAKSAISAKFKTHIENLPNKNSWVFAPKYQSSVQNILTEITNSMLDISPYTKSARYSDGRTIAEFYEDEGFSPILKYLGSNWNYIVLMNLLQNRRNRDIQNIPVEDETLKTRLLGDVVMDIRNAKIRNASLYDYDQSQYVNKLYKAAYDIKKYFDCLDLWNFVLQIKQDYYKPESPVQKNIPTASMQITKNHLPNGIYNEGGTCYLSAALQCLYNSAPIRTAIQDLSQSPQNKLAQDINNIFIQLGTGNAGSVNFKGAVRKLAKDIRMPATGNQDPSESIGNIIDILIDQEIATELNNVKQKYIKSSYSLKKAEDEEELRHNSTIGKICDLKYADITICSKCSNRFIRDARDTKLDIQLPVVKNILLQELIKSFEAEEELKDSNLWDCEQCKQKVQTSKRIVFSTLPKVLGINLKRYFVNNKKLYYNGNEVLCPDILKIRQYKYRLCSLLRGGGLGGGHIVMAGYADDGTPYIANDSKVSLSNKLSTTKAQMVFYELME
ncbi:MAG: ubiquitin carboxyl-terminal hydrolase [Alphaproteobacteria bacterium]|nr:ubiquitin carboxyl-terminal hydrolase [Alphaproteobacteria bacterium]